VTDECGGNARRRRLDRAGLPPAQTPLSDRRDQPGRVRGPTYSAGTSRLTLCPPNGAKPTGSLVRWASTTMASQPARGLARLLWRSPESYLQVDVVQRQRCGEKYARVARGRGRSSQQYGWPRLSGRHRCQLPSGWMGPSHRSFDRRAHIQRLSMAPRRSAPRSSSTRRPVPRRRKCSWPLFLHASS
jgi:hypothetical protein